jgi:hypothetical protein
MPITINQGRKQPKRIPNQISHNKLKQSCPFCTRKEVYEEGKDIASNLIPSCSKRRCKRGLLSCIKHKIDWGVIVPVILEPDLDPLGLDVAEDGAVSIELLQVQ